MISTYVNDVRTLMAHRSELISVQWLRGLAVLMVLAYHVEDIARTIPEFYDLKTFWVHLGYSAPDLFFVISGFIMCYVTFGMTFSPRRWLASRFIRIYPLYIAFTFLAFLVWLINPAMTMGAGEQTWGSVLKSFLIIPQPGLPLVFVGWTVEHEIVFYLLVFCVAALGGRAKALLITLGVLSALASLRWWLKDSYPILDFWDWHVLSLYMIQFLIGALVFQFRERLQHWRWIAPVAIGTGLFLLGGFIVEPGTVNNENLLRVLIFGAAYGLILLGFINCEMINRPMQQPTRRPFMAHVGDASYSLYLSHPFFLSAGGKILNVLQVQGAVAAIAVIALGFAALLAGMVFYHVVEKPFLLAMKRVISK